MSTAKNELTAARLQRLFSGDYARRPLAGAPATEDTTAEVLVLPGADLRGLEALALDPRSLVVAPGAAGLRSGDVRGARVLGYDGDPTADDEEMLVSGGLVVGFESYITAAFVPLTSPTVIRMGDADDHASFVEDADAAVDTGSFPDFLVHPLAMLADSCALGTEHPCAAPRASRAVVGPDGTARPSLGGLPFSEGGGEGLACSVCLGELVAAAALTAARAQRPWLSRYLGVLEVLQLAGGRFTGPVRVSGFGHRLNAGLPDRPVEATTAPVLLLAGEEHLICDPVTRRVLRIGADAARAVEVLLASEGREDAAEEVARHLELPVATAAAVVVELQGTLDELGFPLRLGAPA